MASGNSFSRVSVTRPHGKVDTPKPCDRALMRTPTRRNSGSHNFLKSSKKIDDIEDKLKKLLVFVRDKDLFAMFYRKKMTRRLLFSESTNEDLERMMVEDISLSKENHVRLKDYLRTNEDPRIDFEVRVSCMESFCGFYGEEWPHKRLRWLHSLGSCKATAYFKSATVEMLIVRLLHSLSSGDYKVLVKIPESNSISYNDNFLFNGNFTPTARRIKRDVGAIHRRIESLMDREYLERDAHDPELVKRIASLIDREYLERDADDPKLIKYVA
ncbi:hypothetical protein CRG98_011325 [Punica granatum]|uniref:Cullin family profile domain-containing protein n=1 Tax=Punica granatum TaxID=22663 RepID=A0A2I0KIE8_PUNGR|nr:hypothetical protein CRG98_011325 [Punica granatum]